MVATAKATRAVAAVATPRTTRSLSAIHKGGRREPPPADPSHDAAGSSNAAAAVDEGSLAARHLISADPRFEAVVNAHGTLCLRRGGPESGSAFAALVKTICFQQLAGKAATTIHGRANCVSASAVELCIAARVCVEGRAALGAVLQCEKGVELCGRILGILQEGGDLFHLG